MKYSTKHDQVHVHSQLPDTTNRKGIIFYVFHINTAYLGLGEGFSIAFSILIEPFWCVMMQQTFSVLQLEIRKLKIHFVHLLIMMQFGFIGQG